MRAKPPKWLARWVAGVVAICSAGATILSLFKQDRRLIVFSVVGIVAAILLLIVVERAVREAREGKGQFYNLIAKTLVLFVFLYGAAVAVRLFPTLLDWFKNESPPKPGIVVSPSPIPPRNPATTGPPLPDQVWANVESACKPPENQCTVFVFDYLHEQIGGDELQFFQNTHVDRLDKGIRSHLQSFDLLKGIQFRVVRCSATTITENSLADRALQVLKVPAVMWGFIKKLPDNRLVSTTTISLTDNNLRNLGTREEFGSDVTQLLDLASPIKGNPLAIATLIVGDVHARAGKPDLARKAFLHAKELAVDLKESDRPDFLLALQNRLAQLDARAPVSNLHSITSGNP